MASDAAICPSLVQWRNPEADSEGGHRCGHFRSLALSGSKLCSSRRGPLSQDVSRQLSRTTLARHSLVEGTNPQVAATGRFSFEQRGGIWAVKFDAKRLAVTGATGSGRRSPFATSDGSQCAVFNGGRRYARLHRRQHATRIDRWCGSIEPAKQLPRSKQKAGSNRPTLAGRQARGGEYPGWIRSQSVGLRIRTGHATAADDQR